MLALKLNKAIGPKLRNHFDMIRDYAVKESKLLEIEKEVQTEKDFEIKNRILYSWALLLDRRESTAKFIASRQEKIRFHVLQELKQYCFEKKV